MKKLNWLPKPEKTVLTEMTIHEDLLEYNCPQCGQKLKSGINGNDEFSITYPEGTSMEAKMDHNHEYPIYLNVDFFEQRGLDLPVFGLRDQVNQVAEEVKKSIR